MVPSVPRYDERQYLADIEEHLGVTIQQIGKDMNIQVDEFDGKVVYGEKRRDTGEEYLPFFESCLNLVHFNIHSNN